MIDEIKNRWAEFSERVLRHTRRFSDFFPIAIVLSLIVTLAGTLLSMVIFAFSGISKLFMWVADGSDNMYQFLRDYADFFGIWIAVLLVILLIKHNRPMWNMLKPGRRTPGQIGAGILLGFGSNAFCILMAWLMGDIKLYFNRIDIVPLAAFIIVVFIQSGAEELADRLYLYSKLRRRYRSPLFAFLINSATFAAMHLFNPGITAVAVVELLVTGVIFTELVYWYDGLWIAMAFHASWNFSQSIFFGLPNSGLVSEYSVFKLDAASAVNGLFYNVGFGVEGSVGSALLQIAIAVVIYLINRNKPEKLDVWAPYDVAPVTEGGTDGPDPDGEIRD